MTEVRKRACALCPYRRDVPPGIWAPEEYDKLRPYDRPTMDQPARLFMCHAGPDLVCHGWAVVHTSGPHDRDLLALRFHPGVQVPPASTDLFLNAASAADHGQQPMDKRARQAVAKLVAAYERLREDR